MGFQLWGPRLRGSIEFVSPTDIFVRGTTEEDTSQRMDARLVSTAGRCRGGCWNIAPERGLLIGRGADCDVTLPEASVSRQHCRLSSTPEGLHLEDLGSRNPALVNGVPMRRGTVRPGDELSIGSHQFLLVCEGLAAETASEKDDHGDDTLSWSESTPLSLELDSARDGIQARPGTVQDLAFLFDITRELGLCPDIVGLFQTLRHRMTERFDPITLWTMLAHGRGGLVSVPEESRETPPLALLLTCLKERRGMLAPGKAYRGNRKVRTFTMAAPISVGEQDLGVVALRTETPRAVYDEADLRLLVLLCQSLAPAVCAVESLEQLRRDNERLRARAGESLELIGRGTLIRDVRTRIAQSAPSNLNVLITGETGTGKELVARLVHTESALRSGPFVVVNCAAIPRDLFESEFFGYERGAFTGAQRRFDGLLVQAHGGTLFLDEIGELSLENQARILRAVEEGKFRRVGGNEEERVRVRIIAATNKDLRRALALGQFRNDLFHRLNGFEIHIPPLSERISDIPLLAEHFFSMAKNQAKRPLSGFAPETLVYLQNRPWRGNVRELRNWVLRAVALATSEWIHPDISIEQLPETALDVHAPLPAVSLAEMERRHIAAVLAQCGGNIKEAAKVLRLARSTLYAKIAEYDLK